MAPNERLILDLNSMLNAALLRGTDIEFGRTVQAEDGKSVQVNSAKYGVEGFVQKFVEVIEQIGVAPIDVIGVWDGSGAKMYRRNFLPQYKEGRDKHPAVYEELNTARETVTAFLRAVGCTVMEQAGAEADDVIAYLAQNLQSQCVVHTRDGDLCVLVDEKTDVWRNGQMSVNPYGPFPHKHILTYKSLVGDTSDRIPGAKGFGDKAFVDLVSTFGVDGLDAMLDLIQTNQLGRLSEDVEDLPVLRKIIDSQDQVVDSWRAARLYPGRVNTNQQPLTILAGMVKPFNELPEICQFDELRPLCQQVKLVSAENYERSLAHFRKHVGDRFEVALDIETSTPPESDEWLAFKKKRDSSKGGVDVLASRLTGMSITYGSNLQYTVYIAVDHVEEDGVTNITVDQCREFCEAVPRGHAHVIHNRNFEFTVLYKAWGDKWKDNGWHGFVPNALDTAIEASYVDENQPRGLKHWSSRALGYRQTTYEEVTQGLKMNAMTAREVLAYGADDTVCTAALHNYFRIVMELEHTWNTYLQVEQIPEYLTTLAYVQGLNYSPSRLRELIKQDQAAYDKLWADFRQYLIDKGWGGTQCPVYEELTPASIKEAFAIVTGREFTSRKRKLDALVQEMSEQITEDDVLANLLVTAVQRNDLDTVNRLVADQFSGEPEFNPDSTRQKQKFLYQVVGATPRIYGALTDKQRQDPEMVRAFQLLRKFKENPDLDVPDEVRQLWVSKASTDDDAVALALHMDKHLPEADRHALETYAALRKIQTRFKMFYEPYQHAAHWQDGKLHPSLIQCEAVTRRYSSRDPNIQQLPARGEGIRFRELILPHHKDAVVVSIDWGGQELRLMAEECRDENMLSCFLGENKRDMHSLVAVSAAPSIWGEEVSYDDFIRMRKQGTEEERAKADDLRNKGKTCNFSTQFGAMAPTLAIHLLSDEETAQKFIDAKDGAFPRINQWKAEFEAEAKEQGYATTRLGARRHLRNAFRSEDKWDLKRAERQASNFRIQSSGGEMARLAMKSLWESGIFTGRLDARWMFPVHDEVVFSVHRDQAHEAIRIAHACMVQPYAGMVVPLESEVAIGRDFGRMEVLGTQPNKEKTEEILDGLFSE